MINYNDIMNELVKVQPMSTPPAIKAYWESKVSKIKTADEITQDLISVQPMDAGLLKPFFNFEKKVESKDWSNDPIYKQDLMTEEWKKRENVNWKTGYQGRYNRFMHGAWKVTIEEYKDYMSCFDSLKDKCSERTLKEEEKVYNDFIKCHTDNPTCMLIYYDSLCSAMQCGRKGFMIVDEKHKEIADHIIWRS